VERPEEWSGVDPASALADNSGQVVLHSLQYVEHCSRRAMEYCVAVLINDKNCSLSIVLTAMDQNSKNHKKVILLNITLTFRRRDGG